MNKEIMKLAQKKSGDELQDYLQFQRRGTTVQAKKGRGSYSRKQKHRSKDYLK